MSERSDIKKLNPKERQFLIDNLKLAFRSRFLNQEKIVNLANKPTTYRDNKFYKYLIEDFESIFKVDAPFSASTLVNLFHKHDKTTYTIEIIDALNNYILKAAELPHLPSFPLERKLNDSLRSEIGKYKLHLVHRYKTIRLGIIDFEMKIEFIIPLSLNPPKKIKKQIDALEYERSKLKGAAKSEINEKIEKLQALLDNLYDMAKIIKQGKNIYIQAPAGMGKTTFLKWITYSLARNSFGLSHTIIPIFVELRLYHKSLILLINKSLKGYTNFEELRESGMHILLSIDGFDEFTGNVRKLLQQIHWIAEGENVQIFFSGRVKPKYENFLKMKLFTLQELSMTDVEEILINVFRDKGKEYFIKLKGIWKKELYNPLHLTLVMALIKEKKEFDPTFIKSILKNKGNFYKVLVVDRFIKEYEWKRTPEISRKDVNQKGREIEVISYLAYIMTYSENDAQALERVLIEEALQRYTQ